MENNSKKFSMKDAAKLANSDAGKQLLSHIQKSNPKELEQALTQAAQGDYSNLSETLKPLLASEQIQKLLKQMGG